MYLKCAAPSTRKISIESGLGIGRYSIFNDSDRGDKTLYRYIRTTGALLMTWHKASYARRLLTRNRYYACLLKQREKKKAMAG